MTNVICKWCKSPFQARTADVKRGWGKFCSKSCKASEQEKRTHQNANYKQRQIAHDDMSIWNEANAANEMGLSSVMNVLIIIPMTIV